MSEQMDRRYLKVAQASTPDGHLVRGPSKRAPHFQCSCGEAWSAGAGHPEPSAAQADESESADVPEAPDRAFGYPYDA